MTCSKGEHQVKISTVMCLSQEGLVFAWEVYFFEDITWGVSSENMQKALNFILHEVPRLELMIITPLT